MGPPLGEAGTRRGKMKTVGNTGGKTSVVRGDDGGHKASGVAHESPGVGDKEGGREASGVAENPGGGGATEWAGKSSCHRLPEPL